LQQVGPRPDTRRAARPLASRPACAVLGSTSQLTQSFQARWFLRTYPTVIDSRHLAPPDRPERIEMLCGTLQGAASKDCGMVAYTLAGEERPTWHQVGASGISDQPISLERIGQWLRTGF
jgi:hypothetical protein